MFYWYEPIALGVFHALSLCWLVFFFAFYFLCVRQMVLFANFIPKEVIGKVPIKINVTPCLFLLVSLQQNSFHVLSVKFCPSGDSFRRNISISFQRHALNSFYLNKKKKRRTKIRLIFFSFHSLRSSVVCLLRLNSKASTSIEIGLLSCCSHYYHDISCSCVVLNCCARC